MQENNTPQEESIETQLAYWLDSFSGHLEFTKNAQQHLHDSLLTLDEQLYNKKEKDVVNKFLNSVLSLTFLIKDNPEKIKAFISYQTNTPQ